jgi:hypothetical protein
LGLSFIVCILQFRPHDAGNTGGETTIPPVSQPEVNNNYGHKIQSEEARHETRAQEKGRRQKEEVVAGLQLSPLVSNQRRQIF